MSAPVVIFAYNFPHKKTQEILLRCHLEGLTVAAVLAADPVAIPSPPNSIRVKLRHEGLVHPRIVAERIGAPYHVVPHEEAIPILTDLKPALGVVAGARILGPDVIHSFKTGILNFHPGLIPEVRGLDALLWSIEKNQPPGVTAHLIDRKVDAGKVLIRKRIPVHPDDTILDLNERLFETQLELLGPAVEAALRGDGSPVEGPTPPNRKMTDDQIRATLDKLPAWRKQMAEA